MSFVAPDACTLPTVEQPVRVAEFDALFGSAVRRVETVGTTRARLWLTGGVGLAETVRDLTAREVECCSFFTFGITTEAVAEGEALTLDIEVPTERAEVLAALVQRTHHAAGRA